MLLRPSNTLLLDEPTNHLDLDSKEVLLDALVDYGGTLIFVSHDRYFVERLATKILEVGNLTAQLYPGTYKEFLWSKENRRPEAAPAVMPARNAPSGVASKASARGGAAPREGKKSPPLSHEEKKKHDAEARKKQRAAQARQSEIARLEARIAETEAAIKELEQAMSAPGFYEDRAASQTVVARHQALMWKVGDLMHQWEELQTHPTEP